MIETPDQQDTGGAEQYGGDQDAESPETAEQPGEDGAEERDQAEG